MDSSSPEFLKLWNFQKPGQTRTSFLKVLSEKKLDESEILQLKTQIARTYSLESNFEELAELYLVTNKKDKARKYFKLAYTELSKDKWLMTNEPERMKRIKELSNHREET